MHAVETVVLLLAIAAALSVVARRLGVAYPILAVIVGLGLGLFPGFPRVELEPDIVLLIFLPPILFAAAYDTSLREFLRNLRPITLLAFGLVLATTTAVALVVMFLVPGMPPAAAFALGAIVSPPDAIAATSIAKQLRLPRRLVTIIEGESLVNDATALVTYRFAVAAALTGTFSFGEAATSFVIVAVGGAVIGLAVGVALNFIFSRLNDPPIGILISFLAPFAAYLSAEALHLSGVLAAVAAGLWHGWRAPRLIPSETRLLGTGTWQTMIFVVNALAFMLIGLQLPTVVEAVSDRPVGQLATLAVAVVATVILVRVLWVFPATHIPRWIVPGLAERDPAPPASVVAVLGWTGMRGAVSLAAALALPTLPPFPERDLILFLTFVTILVTLVGQGLTLPTLIKRLGVTEDADSDQREENAARRAAVEAGLLRLDQLEAEDKERLPLIDKLRGYYEHRSVRYGATERHRAEAADAIADDYLDIRRAALAAERTAVIELRERGDIGNEVLRRLEREIDLEELRELP